MKTILSPLCGLALLSGIAMAAPDYTMFKPDKDRPVTYYRRPLPPVCPTIEQEPRNITTELALKRRAALWRKGLAIAQTEAMFYPSTPARVSGRVPAHYHLPPPPPVIIQAAPFPSDPGAPMGPGGGMPPPPGQLPMPPLPIHPPEIAPLENGASRGKADIPMAKSVSGKPGFVISPFDPVTGFVDVNGMAPGSEVRDPYTGRVFRIP